MWPFKKQKTKPETTENTIELLSTDDVPTRAKKICQAAGLVLNVHMQSRLPVIEKALEFYQMADMRRSRIKKDD